jgi:hypothetical protein
MRVGDLVEELEGNQPNVSKHLQILYEAGIDGRRREGSSIVYSLNDPSVLKLCELVHRNETKKEQGKPRLRLARHEVAAPPASAHEYDAGLCQRLFQRMRSER